MVSPARSAPVRRTGLGLLLAVVAAILLWWSQGDAGPTDPAPSDPPSAQSSPGHEYTATTTRSSDPSAAPTSGPTTDPTSGLPSVRPADLPPKAREALQRIDRGGPFPYPEDDGVFENREDLLPQRPTGHYREYTVGGRPGDRGPLRIVAGADGERYWTDDHYRSFSRIEVG